MGRRGGRGDVKVMHSNSAKYTCQWKEKVKTIWDSYLQLDVATVDVLKF